MHLIDGICSLFSTVCSSTVVVNEDDKGKKRKVNPPADGGVQSDYMILPLPPYASHATPQLDSHLVLTGNNYAEGKYPEQLANIAPKAS
jgi:hypothetical protein